MQNYEKNLISVIVFFRASMEMRRNYKVLIKFGSHLKRTMGFYVKTYGKE